MKIKDTLDLCGWELWNFCIQNHQNLEGLLDLGAGRKVFYTGNDQGKNGREVIYDGSKWKVSAYMSDVEGVQSNLSALTERVNAFLDGEVNSNEVLDNLKEIQAFLDAYPEATSLVQILDTKFNKTGGTIEGDVQISSSSWAKQLVLNNSSGAAGVRFHVNDAMMGIIYVNDSHKLLFHDGTTSNLEIFHTGNYVDLIGDYYLKTTGGVMKFSSVDSLIIRKTTNNLSLIRFDGFINSANTPMGYLGFYGVNNPVFYDTTTKPFTLLHAGNFVNLIGDTYLKTDGSNKMTGRLYMDSNAIEWDMNNTFQLLTPYNANDYKLSYYDGSSWKTLAFTDSNVASATKLETPRTIWGQSFDGTGDVGGTLSGVNNIYMNEGYRFYIGGVDSLYLYPSQKTIYIGYGAGTTYATAIAGNEVSLRYGGLNTGFILNSSGNVTIGESDLATSANGNPKLYVDGGTTINVFNSKGEEGILGAKTEGSFFLGKNFGLQLWTNGYGNVYGQVGRIDGTPTAYNLILQHLGGNILIGTTSELNSGAKLQIKGDLYVEGNIIATKEVSAGGAGTEGEGGAGGFSLYESWGTSAPTEPLALGANLGYELKTRVEDLELAKTKVEISDTLASGKPIGTITIDGNKTNLFAPATYAWSEIDGRPTTIEGYGIDDAFTKNESDARYLKKSGGTIDSTGYLGLNINSPDNSLNQLTLSADGILKGIFQFNTNYGVGFHYSNKGGIYIDNDGLPQFVSSSSSSEKHPLLHSGNVGEYALKTDGSNAMKDGVKWEERVLNSENTPQNSGLQLFSFVDSATSPSGASIYWSTLSAVTNYVGFQISSHGSSDSYMHPVFRKMYDDGTWSDWKTIAFTDSNVAGAYKLVHTDGASIIYNSGKTFYVGDSIYPTVSTNILGKEIALRYGASATNGLILNSSGNVTIGGSDIAEENWKFAVDNGSFLLNGLQSANPTLGSRAKNAMVIGSANYGLQMWSLGNGSGHIQVSSFTTATAYALNLNPLGGAVNIASANANTNVLGHLFASKDLYMNGFLMMNRGGEGIYIAGASLNWHNTNDAWSASILSFAKDSFTIHPSLYVNGLANFSSRVLIGGAADDGASHLQIKGTTRVHATTNWETESIKISSYGIQYYGRKDGGYVQGLMFYSYDGVSLCELGYNTNAFFIGSSYNNPWLSIINNVFDVHVPTQLSSSLAVTGTSTFGGQSTFNALALFNKPIVAKDKLQIGDATLRWDEDTKALTVDKSFASQGEISAGGAGTEGGNTGGGGTGTITNPYVVTFTPSQETSHTFYHNLPYYDVVVQVYEKNAISGAWDMILADVTIANESRLVTVDFGRKENVEHKIVVR